MKYSILLLLLIAAFRGKGQIPPIYSPGMPPPLFDTVKSHQPKLLSDHDRLAALEKRVQYLDRAYTELRRRFDSLMAEREMMKPDSNHMGQKVFTNN